MSIYLGNQLIAGDNSSFANQDLSNITATGKTVISSLGMPANTYSLSTLAQNTEYTAAESGYFQIVAISNIASSSQLYLKNNTANLQASFEITATGGYCIGYIPVAKGDKFLYNAGGSFRTINFYFTKCKGD